MDCSKVKKICMYILNIYFRGFVIIPKMSKKLHGLHGKRARICEITGRFRKLGRCFIDWATAVVGKGDTSQLSVSFTYPSSGPIYETLAQSTEFDGIQNTNVREK